MTGYKKNVLVPFGSFVERIRLTKEMLEKGYKVEVWKEHLYCYKFVENFGD